MQFRHMRIFIDECNAQQRETSGTKHAAVAQRVRMRTEARVLGATGVEKTKRAVNELEVVAR